MRVTLLIGFILITGPTWVSSTSDNGLERNVYVVQTEKSEDVNLTMPTFESKNITLQEKSSEKPEILLYTVIRKIKNLWYQDDDSNFAGRCFRLAKKIRQLIPIAIFKMGVIMTLLGFLTLFSLKSLGMLGILLLINTSGAVGKITAAAFSHKEEKRPSTVHFHIHKDDDYHGGYHIGHTGPGHEWDRKSKINQEIIDLDRMESYNLYNKLLNDLASKNYNIK